MILKDISVNILTQIKLDASRKQAIPGQTFDIKEISKGRNQGVFIARVLGNGAVDFYFKYYIKGQEKLKKIGRYGVAPGELLLVKAKAEFRKLSALYHSGIDPKVQAQEIAQKLENEEKAQRELERKKQMQGSIGQLSEFFLDHLKQTAGETHFRNVQNAFKKDLFQINPEKKASDITKDEIIHILHIITKRGAKVMANRMRSYLSAMFNYGMVFDDSVESFNKEIQFNIQSNPVTKVQKIIKNERKGERTLTEDDVRIFWRALENSGMSVLRINAFKLILLTGCRVGEIAGLQWKEIDHTAQTINLPSERTKNKLPLIIPINKSMLEIINSNPKLHDIYLFPAKNNEEPQRVDGFSQAISRLLMRTELDKFTPRDLRRTFKTLAAKAEISKEIRDRLQNHSLQDVSSKHYDKHDYLTEKRAAMDKWNDYFMSILNKN